MEFDIVAAESRIRLYGVRATPAHPAPPHRKKLLSFARVAGTLQERAASIDRDCRFALAKRGAILFFDERVALCQPK